STRSAQGLEEALDYALKRGVLIVVAAGNQSTVGGSTLTRHRWGIPVVACDQHGRPTYQSKFGHAIGWRRLRAPWGRITSLGAGGAPYSAGGTSAAAPFVTGAIALLWSLYPAATAAEVKLAITYAATLRRTTLVPPLLDAWAAYQQMESTYARRSTP